MRIQEDPLRPCLAMRKGMVEVKKDSRGFYKVVLNDEVTGYGAIYLGHIRRIDNDDLKLHGWKAWKYNIHSDFLHKTVRDAAYWLLEQSGTPFAPYAAPKNPDLKEQDE